jgi:hypothetical protein
MVLEKAEECELPVKRIAGLLLTTILLSAPELLACSVCFGDQKSPLTLGAKAGVFFLLGVIGFVLAAIFAVTLFWMRRAKLVAIQNILHGESETGQNQEHVAESI